MNIYWESFKTFFKIGIFTLGGGYAMIPLIEEEVVNKHRWVEKEEMLDLIAIAIFFKQFEDNRIVAAIFRGIRPAVVALIAVPTFRLGQRAKLNKFTIWIPIVCALLIWALGVSPIYIILAAGLAGYIYGRLNKGTDDTAFKKDTAGCADDKKPR